MPEKVVVVSVLRYLVSPSPNFLEDKKRVPATLVSLKLHRSVQPQKFFLTLHFSYKYLLHSLDGYFIFPASFLTTNSSIELYFSEYIVKCSENALNCWKILDHLINLKVLEINSVFKFDLLETKLS